MRLMLLLALLGIAMVGVAVTYGRNGGAQRAGLQGAYELPALRHAAATRPAEPAAPGTDAGPAGAERAGAPVAAPSAALPPPAVPPALSAAATARAAQNVARPPPEPEAAGVSLPALPDLLAITAPETDAADATADGVPAGGWLALRYVTAEAVNLRVGPSTEAPVIGRLTRGDAVGIVEDPGSGWSRVRIEGSGIEGWVASRFLAD